MKRLFTLLILALCLATADAQSATEARKVLDKTAKVLGNKGGAQASFTISSEKIGSTNGVIAIKGNRFYARTPQATVWFDGKTQWSYMKNTDEVNVTTPTRAQQMAMNPYTFINMYKSGYTLSMTTKGNNHTVRLVAQSKQQSVQEMYITISKTTFTPSIIKMRQGQTWSTIRVSNFKAKNFSNKVFTFNSKDFPTAEVIDLR